jgi:recombination protein RecA
MLDEKLINGLQKKYGQDILFSLSDREDRSKKVETIPTGITSIDQASGVGGIPRGRITEIFGGESSGKSTLCLHIAKEAQQMGGNVVYVDMEATFDEMYAENVGVNIENNFMISYPDTGEEAFDVVETLVRSEKVDLVIVDSVSLLIPKAELEGEMTDSNMGVMARMMGKGMRRLTQAVRRSNCALIFINQVRDNIGGYGSPKVTSGGRALKFSASMRIELGRRTVTKESGIALGNDVRVLFVKNKVAPPLKECVVPIRFGEGFDFYGDIVNLAIQKELLKVARSWIVLPNEEKVQGRQRVIEVLKKDSELCEDLLSQLL